MSRLASIIDHLPYYWKGKTSRDRGAIQRLVDILAALDEGQTLPPADQEFLAQAPVYQRLLGQPARAMDVLDEHMESTRRSRDLDWAWGWILDLLAMNVGVKRPRGFYAPGPLDDPWMRELVRLFVWCHTARGSADDIAYAVAWFIGIAWRNPNWKTEILPHITLTATERTTPSRPKEYQYFEIHLPWKLVSLYAHDHIFVADTDGYPAGEGFWIRDEDRGLDVGILDGHHLLTDLIAFLRHIVPAGYRFEIFGTGFYVADTDAYPVGQGFWVEDPHQGLDVGRMPGLLEDGALEPMDERDYEQLRIAPYSYTALQKELVHRSIRVRDGAY